MGGESWKVFMKPAHLAFRCHQHPSPRERRAGHGSHLGHLTLPVSSLPVSWTITTHPVSTPGAKRSVTSGTIWGP